MKIFFLTIILALVFTACGGTNDSKQEEENNKQDLTTLMQGTWQTYQINVAVNSVDGLDSFATVNLNEGVWERNLGVQPPVHYFHADQQYRLVHRALDGELISEDTGSWAANGDTLTIKKTDEQTKYHVKHNNGRAGLRTLIDWDGDGAKDDEYQSLQRKISIGTEG